MVSGISPNFKRFLIIFYSPGGGTSIDDYEIVHEFPDIGTRTMLLNANRLIEDSGPGLILLVIEDITEQREKEKKLLVSEVRYRKLFETAQDGILLIDPVTESIIDANPFILRMMGHSLDEVLGKKLWEIGAVKDKKANEAIFKELQTKGYVRYENLPLQSKDGQEHEVEFVSNVYSIGDSDMIQCNIRDVSDRMTIERAKTEFISIASHQLRTPVSGLNWLTEALELGSAGFTPKQKKYVKELSILSKRLIELIEDLLDFSRIELKTEVTTVKDKIDISDFVEEFLKEIKPYADLKQHTIVFNNSISEAVTIEINKKSLYNVLQNLMSNAIDFSPGNATVTINLEKKDDYAKVSFVNEGPTITKEEKPHIFQRFYRAESAKKIKSEGTGLGLYIVKAIIERTGGNVGFESEEGKDVVFWFTIPLKN